MLWTSTLIGIQKSNVTLSTRPTKLSSTNFPETNIWTGPSKWDWHPSFPWWVLLSSFIKPIALISKSNLTHRLLIILLICSHFSEWHQMEKHASNFILLKRIILFTWRFRLHDNFRLGSYIKKKPQQATKLLSSLSITLKQPSAQAKRKQNSCHRAVLITLWTQNTSHNSVPSRNFHSAFEDDKKRIVDCCPVDKNWWTGVDVADRNDITYQFSWSLLLSFRIIF